MRMGRGSSTKATYSTWTNLVTLFATIKPGKVLAKKGKKGIGAITSAERGKNVTVVACVSATGAYIPPIFPRVRIKPELLDGSPTGTVGYANKSGWINVELFEC